MKPDPRSTRSKPCGNSFAAVPEVALSTSRRLGNSNALPKSSLPKKQQRKEASLPPGATLIPSPRRHPGLPVLYLLSSHSKITDMKEGGRIILMMVDWDLEAMNTLFTLSATLSPPTSLKDAARKGFYLLYPSKDDRVVVRNRYGLGLEKDDKLVSWATSKEEVKDKIPALIALREKVLGSRKEMTNTKAKKNPDGSFSGGVGFERHSRARCLKNGPRCYTLSTSIQIQKDLSAPGAQAKVYDPTKDDDSKMRFDLLKLGSELSMTGIRKGGPNLQKTLHTQAAFTNLPRIGSDNNVAHPAFQLNIASAVESSSSNAADIASLGKFGSSHVDADDSPCAPTAMTVLSEDYDGVEVEVFFVMDFGIGWVMEEFSTLFFSGLHFHGGCQPTYKKRRDDPKHIYYRLTLIAYPPNQLLSGTDTVAFATLPNRAVLPIGYELRNPNTSHSLSYRVQSTQATYTGDGSAIFEPFSQLRHFSWATAELVTGIVRQLDPCLLARVDVEKLISSFSCVVNGVRVQAPANPLAPGWRGDDVRIGKIYEDDLRSRFDVRTVEELATKNLDGLVQLHNTDNPSTNAPFGNDAYETARIQWQKHTTASGANIPLLGAVKSKHSLGGRIGTQAKALVKSTRSSGTKLDKKHRSSTDKKKKATSKALTRAIKARKLTIRTLRGNVTQERSGLRSAVDADGVTLAIYAVRSPEHSEPESEDSMDGIQMTGVAISSTGQESKMEVGGEEEGMIGIVASASSDLPAHSTRDCSDAPANLLVTLSLESLLLYEKILAGMKDIQAAGSNLLHPALVDISNFRTQPLSPETRQTVAKIYKTHTSRFNIQANINHLHTLILDVMLLDSLEYKVKTSWPYPRSQCQVQPTGLRKLIIDVATALAHRPVDTQLDAVDYLPGFSRWECIHQIKYHNRTFTSPTAHEVHDRVVRILSEWLSLPEPQKIYPRVWLSLEVVKRLGVHALCLPQIQSAAYHVRNEVLGVGKNKQVTHIMLSEWFDREFDSHAICDPHSDSGIVLGRVLALLTEVFPLEDTIVEDVATIAKRGPHSLPAPYPSIISVVSSAAVSSSSNLPISFSSHELERLVVLLTALYPLVDGLESTSASTDLQERTLHDNFLEKTVRKLPDQRLPFRNLAPSRKRILQGDGPYSSRWKSTIEGFFSSLVYRGITHSTEFLQLAPTLFKDATHFRHVSEQFHGRDASFFCNIGAYGQPCDSRTIDNVAVYWDMANQPGNNGWLSSSEPASFDEVFRIVSRFPAFGDLTTAQFVMDMVECDLVAQPTFEQMGHLIFKMKKGAYEGLKILGFSVNSETDVVSGFRFLHDTLSARIPGDIKPRIDFGIVFLEHLLCKFKRLDTRPFKDYCSYVMKKGNESSSRLST